MSEKLINLLNANFNYNIGNIHTAFPAIVTAYDAKTRRANVQPCLKRKLPEGDFIEFPMLVDVPVIFLQTKKGGIHIPLEKGDSVLIVCSERCIDEWKDKGSDNVESNDIRRFSIADAVAIPGLMAKDFPQGLKTGDQLTIYHKKRVLIEAEKINVGNKYGNLGKVLEDFIDTVAGMKTMGSPATHTISADDMAKLTQIKQTMLQIFDD